MNHLQQSREDVRRTRRKGIRGAMKVNVIGAGALGNNREGIEQIQLGVHGLLGHQHGAFSRRSAGRRDLRPAVPSSRAPRRASRSSTAYVALEVAKPLEEKGIKAVGYMTQGGGTSTPTSPSGPQDLKGLEDPHDVHADPHGAVSRP
jgi:TRAP-type C4-dicarboxylate transport system substrate-binding protein